jgi:hypothetical protein
MLAALLLPPTLGAQQQVDQRRATTPDVSVRLAGQFGALRIVGWDRDSVALTGTLPKGARMEGGWGPGGSGGEPVRGMKMYVELPADVSAAGAKLELRVPKGARVWAKSGIAEIDASGVTGGLDLNIVGGSVRVAGSPREASIESMDGGITVDGSPEWLRAKTATGDITVRGGSSDAALTTVSGTIRVGDGRFERARVESVTGAVVFAGTPDRGASISIDSHSGPIEVRLPAGAGVELDASSVTGTIENGVGVTRPRTGREGRGQELTMLLGSGSGRLVIRSFKGNIALRAR